MSNHMDDIQRLIGELTTLAFTISARGLAHCFVHYHGHTQQLDVFAHPINTRYGSHEKPKLLRHMIYVDGLDPDTTEQLQDALGALQRLLNQTTNTP